MTEIKNYEVYNQRMEKTLCDKIWWIPNLDEDIDYVIDYGCGLGDLSVPIKMFCNVEYIGIDNNETMREMGKKKYPDNKYYSSLNDPAFTSRTELKNSQSVLVLNSVLHEIKSYCSADEIYKLCEDILELYPKYIAIRDMNTWTREEDISMVSIFDTCIKNIGTNPQYAKQFSDLIEIYSNSKYAFQNFVLKYKYIENWDREKGETYIFDAKAFAERIISRSNYKRVYCETFNIPYQIKQIKDDLGFDLSKHHTHIKMLYKILPEEERRKQWENFI